MTLEELRKLKPQIQAIAREHKIDPDSIRVFGSVARGDTRAESDVDFLITTLPGCSVFDLGGMFVECAELLGSKVDIVSDKGIDPYMAPYILAHVVQL